ncbi:MAG TPA: c-type cytochrome [Gemmataceae bacterium]|nr:c-type cytochrome [Gemmataceae bacterium]
MKPLHKGRWRLLPLLAALLAGCDFPGQPKPADRPVPAEEVTDFDALYATRCAGCHGADGKLGPAPPLNDPIFLAIVPDTELLRVITEGRAVTSAQKSPMPGFGLGKGGPLTEAQVKVWAELKEETHTDPRQKGPLTEAQIKVLAEGIKKRWRPPAPPPGSVPPYVAPAGVGGGNKEERDRVFARACAGCHGKEGEGVERDGRLRRKINDPAFLALISDQALRRYAITGRPDLGMPAYDSKDGRSEKFEPLTSAEVGDLVALLADWRRGGPANEK